MKLKIAVAILNWNGKELLEKYLPSVNEHSNEHSVYLIDNNSSDESVAYVESEFPNIKIIQTGVNLGYAGGYNAGLKGIKEEYAVLLNSDVRTTPGWLDPIVKHFDLHTRCGAVQPKILWDRQPEKFEYAGASGGFIDSLGYPFCRGRILHELEIDHGQYDDAVQVFWATGACLAVRMEAFHDAGELDSMLFAHMEEIDLCWRMQRAGYEIWVEPQSTVYHLGGATLNADSPRKTYLNFRNNLIILVKNLPQLRALGVVFIRLLLDGIAAIKFVLEGKPSHALAILKAHFGFYSRFTKIQRNRMSISHLPLLPMKALKGTYKGSMVWQFYGKGIKYFSRFHR
ncbi:glycosyltransferase family 2 protein [Schleiferiaceae bacterium]|nr:glycosyltransferase family 2 protein [Schleiferiaceae bacterium]|tara:strand:+ start:1616 stop:2641 length:1026 start_codon:yes stop_codon:yes gene_type:complete